MPNLHLVLLFTQNVLLTIEIDSSDVKSGRVPFANISQFSFIPDEEEVLFLMHSTFLVKSVKLDEDNIWNIDLKFIDNLLDIDFGERSIFSSNGDQIFIRNLSKENKQFVAFQLLVDLILRADQTVYTKAELIEFSRARYNNDLRESKKIDDFEKKISI